jgi:O-acetyl-ADP-ribose deacetylase (regulator of RNase III)
MISRLMVLEPMDTDRVLRLTAVHGDITQQSVDAIVNAANNAMRGGGGVDGAIHRAGGPAILRDCVERFPHGLATGDAGWTTAGELPARWVIHTVGPNYAAGQQERSLLESCYRRALEVADELGAHSVAFPLISTGVYRWPLQDAIAVAVDTVAAAQTTVRDVRLVAFDADTEALVTAGLDALIPIRILQGVKALHDAGFHQIRIIPGIGGPGCWRITITTADNIDYGPPGVVLRGFTLRDNEIAIRYSAVTRTNFAGGEVTPTSPPQMVADLILRQLSHVRAGLAKLYARSADPGYAAWFAGLMHLVEQQGLPPVSYGDYFDDRLGWQIGWKDGGTRYPAPLAPP